MIQFSRVFFADHVPFAQLNICSDDAAPYEANSDVYTSIRGIVASEISASLFCVKLPGFTQLLA